MCCVGICGFCVMMVNGRLRLVCKILIFSFESGVIMFMFMFSFMFIKDLSVNIGDWFGDMIKRVESWAYFKEEVDIIKLEKRIEFDEV